MISITSKLREVGRAPNGYICILWEEHHPGWVIWAGNLANIKNMWLYNESFGGHQSDNLDGFGYDVSYVECRWPYG